MLNDNAKKWVEALKSGTYKQATGGLHYSNAEHTYCCLGVACDLYIKSGNELDVRNIETSLVNKSGEPHKIKAYAYDHAFTVLPDKVKVWLGLATHSGRYQATDWYVNGLVNLNDGGHTFEEIAKVIELEPKGLFIETK